MLNIGTLSKFAIIDEHSIKYTFYCYFQMNHCNKRRNALHRLFNKLYSAKTSRYFPIRYQELWRRIVTSTSSVLSVMFSNKNRYFLLIPVIYITKAEHYPQRGSIFTYIFRVASFFMVWHLIIFLIFLKFGQ